MASARLHELHRQYPHLMDKNAIDHPFMAIQDVTKVTPTELGTISASIVIFATPTCQPFSKAGSTPGWDSEESKPFTCCVNLIGSLSKRQRNGVTYVIETVPNSGQFAEIAATLGPPIIVEAHKLGSSTLIKTTLWTNVATREHLTQPYESSHNPSDTIPIFLSTYGLSDWYPTTHTGKYFPKFMARAGS